MALSYEPLWNLLNRLHVSKMDFAKRIDISNATLAKLGKNEPVTLTVIEKICDEFHCNIKDVVTHISDPREHVPADLLKIGTIVECPCLPFNVRPMQRVERIYRSAESPQVCVILNFCQENGPYLIAPLILDSTPLSILDIPIDNIQIGNSIYSGYVDLSHLGSIQLQYIIKILGKVPVQDKRFRLSNILNDLTTFLLNYNLVPKAALHTVGLIEYENE